MTEIDFGNEEEDGETFDCGIHVVGVDECGECDDCPCWCECEGNH